MTRLLHTDHTTGAVTLKGHPNFTPPNGLTLPASQDTQAVAPSSRTLGTLFSGSDPNPLPTGLQVHIGNVPYVYGDITTGWVDMTNYQDANSVSVSGSIIIRNEGNADIGVTW